MKQNNIIKRWEGIDFKITIPAKPDKNNKAEVYFSVINPLTGKNKQIKKSNGIDRYADVPTILNQAKELVNELIDLMKIGYDPITGKLPDYVKLTSNSKMLVCLETYVKEKELQFDRKQLHLQELTTIKSVTQHFIDWLNKNNLLNNKPDSLNTNDINAFMREVEKQRLVKDKSSGNKVLSKKKLSPRTFNNYISRISNFYNYLLSERVTNFNPVTYAFRYNTKQLDTHYTFFADDELATVKEFLKSPKFTDLSIAVSLLYNYRVRGAEQQRIKIKDINFETSVLTLHGVTIDEDGFLVENTKNGQEAFIKISPAVIADIKSYIGNNTNGELYLFGGHNRPSMKKVSNQFHTNKWSKFRKTFNLPKTLKFYALKHTSNSNQFESVGVEGLMKINRHTSPNQTFDYIKNTLKKQVIIVNESDEF